MVRVFTPKNRRKKTSRWRPKGIHVLQSLRFRSILINMNLRLVAFLVLVGLSASKKPKEKPDWAKKDIRDYSDADLERLLDQWEEDEEPLPPDELPEWDPRRPQAPMDFSNLKDPESLLKASKKGKSLMMFVKVRGNPTKSETDEITGLWQTSLWNNHVQCERFPLDDNRVIFMFKDGSMAWEAKDFLIGEEQCQSVEIEQKTYHGKHTPEYALEHESQKKKTKKKTKKTEL